MFQMSRSSFSWKNDTARQTEPSAASKWSSAAPGTVMEMQSSSSDIMALHEPVEHALLAGSFKIDIQPVVIDGDHPAIAEFLVEHARDHRDFVGSRRAGRCFPLIRLADAPRLQRENRRRVHARRLVHGRRAGPRD